MAGINHEAALLKHKLDDVRVKNRNLRCTIKHLDSRHELGTMALCMGCALHNMRLGDYDKAEQILRDCYETHMKVLMHQAHD